MVNFKRPCGQTACGYRAEPVNDAQVSGGPAMVVLQEWWGLNAQIRGVADRPATARFQALAPEVDAAVVWYGCPPLDSIDASRIKVPLQGHWAAQDDRPGSHPALFWRQALLMGRAVSGASQGKGEKGERGK